VSSKAGTLVQRATVTSGNNSLGKIAQFVIFAQKQHFAHFSVYPYHLSLIYKCIYIYMIEKYIPGIINNFSISKVVSSHSNAAFWIRDHSDVNRS
jgi:hypothetical protein